MSILTALKNSEAIVSRRKETFHKKNYICSFIERRAGSILFRHTLDYFSFRAPSAADGGGGAPPPNSFPFHSVSREEVLCPGLGNGGREGNRAVAWR